jgi:quaternary ammonium compound-resistance protein SugE
MVGLDGWLRCRFPYEYGLVGKSHANSSAGTAYPVWTGIGTVGTVLVGIFVFHEPATFWRLFFITTLIASIIGLKALS